MFNILHEKVHRICIYIMYLYVVRRVYMGDLGQVRQTLGTKSMALLVSNSYILFVHMTLMICTIGTMDGSTILDKLLTIGIPMKHYK